MAEGETELMPLAITAVEPGNKHKEDTAVDVVVAVVETELHPVKHYQVRVTERGQKATCTLLTLEMPRLIEANHHSA
jgi:hypothetical protein